MRAKIQIAIYLVFLGAGFIFTSYLAWTNFLNFRNLIFHDRIWDQGAFYSTIFSTGFAGFILGISCAMLSITRVEMQRAWKEAERQKLKKEIKRELEMDLKKEKGN